jgi:hypothetical protein
MFKRKSKAAKSSKKSTETKDHSKAYSFRTKHEEAPKVLSQRVSYANKRGKKRHVSNFNVEVGNDSHGIEQDILKVNTSKAIEHVAVPSVERNTPNGRRRRRSKSRERQRPTRQRQASKISLADMNENHRPRTPISSQGTLYPRSEPIPRNKSPLCMMLMPIKSCTVPDLSLVKSSDSEESDDHSEDESCESVESIKENYAIPQKHEKHIPFKYRLLCSMDMGQYGANCAVPKINFDLEKQQAPQPWRMYIDGDQYTGTKYWSNGLVSTYEKPKDFVERQEGVWCEFQDWKSGHRYYSNGVITTWTRPANTDVFIDKKTGYRYLISRNCDDNEC